VGRSVLGGGGFFVVGGVGGLGGGGGGGGGGRVSVGVGGGVGASVGVGGGVGVSVGVGGRVAVGSEVGVAVAVGCSVGVGLGARVTDSEVGEGVKVGVGCAPGQQPPRAKPSTAINATAIPDLNLFQGSFMSLIQHPTSCNNLANEKVARCQRTLNLLGSPDQDVYRKGARD